MDANPSHGARTAAQIPAQATTHRRRVARGTPDSPAPAGNHSAARALSRRRLHAFRLAALALAIAVGLLLGEVGLRVAGYSPAFVNAMSSFHEADAVSGHRGKRGFDARFKTPQFDVRIVHDERGFRRAEHQNPADAAARRLFVFGDSFVWGWGVDQGEVFTDQVSRLRPDCWVDNRGINNTGTVAQYELFAAECRDGLRPGDTVLLTFFQNDFADNLEGSRRASLDAGQVLVQPASSHLKPGWKRSLQDNSYLFNYLAYVANRLQLERKQRRAQQQAADLWEQAQAAAPTGAHSPDPGSAAASPSGDAAVGSPPEKAASIAPPAPDASSPQRPEPVVAPAPALDQATQPSIPGNASAQVAIARHFLAQFQHDCEARGARFVVAYIPGMVELQETAGEPAATHERLFRQALFALTESLGIETIDLLPGMLAAKRDQGIERLGIADDGHWNAAGHRVVARIVAEHLAGE